MTRSVSLVVVGILAGVLAASLSPVPEKSGDIEWLTATRTIDSFELARVGGRFSNEDLIGHWTLVLFGFLKCADICPTNLAGLSELSRVLSNQSTVPISVVFISVDPARDTLESLGHYVSSFYAGYIGVTGEIEQLESLADSLGVRFNVSAQLDQTVVAHSVTISIVGPNGKFRGRFRPGFNVDAVAKALVKVRRS
jgi:protein SCO1/2